MELIDNFSLLTKEEQMQFAVELLKKINETGVFSDTIKLDQINPDYEAEANDMDGSLTIYIDLDRLDYSREFATDDVDQDPWEYEYIQDAEEAAAQVFKTTKAVLDGYDLELRIEDIPNEEREDTEIESSRSYHEDDGIGWHEFWGDVAYDSRPSERTAARGNILCYSDALLSIRVERHDD